MSYFLLAGLVFACTLAAQSTAGAGSITGHVFHSLTNAPVRKATVSLTTAQFQLTAESDREGKFEFTGLPVGAYRLSASASGFLDRRTRGSVLLGRDVANASADIRLLPEGLITGRVLDVDGEPADRARVLIFKLVYRHGRKQWDQLRTSFFHQPHR